MKKPVLTFLMVCIMAIGVSAMTGLVPAQGPGIPAGISVLGDPILPPGMPLPPRPAVSAGLSILGDPILPPGMPLPPRPPGGIA